jgi:hypothetical protein
MSTLDCHPFLNVLKTALLTLSMLSISQYALADKKSQAIVFDAEDICTALVLSEKRWALKIKWSRDTCIRNVNNIPRKTSSSGNEIDNEQGLRDVIVKTCKTAFDDLNLSMNNITDRNHLNGCLNNTLYYLHEEKTWLYGGGVQSLEMEALSNEICSELITAQEMTGENSAKVLEKILLKHLKLTKETADYKIKLTQFWNSNINQMICTTPSVDAKSPQHVMHRVLDMGLVQQVFFNFIFELDYDEGINVNAVTFNNDTGQPETVIDYIDAILKDPSNETKYVFREVKDLRKMLIRWYKGKRASEL